MQSQRNVATTIATIAAVAVLSAAAIYSAPHGEDAAAAAKPLNILLMGSDARPGEQLDESGRPDALAVLHLDPATGSCRLLSIPRDTRVAVPGYGMTKINHALMLGGISLQEEVVEQFLGIAIDHYGLIDFEGARRLIDTIGGVTVTNDIAFSIGSTTFPAGTVTLDGREAVLYARYRGGPDGDFGRIRRQHDVMRAAIKQLADRRPVDLLAAVVPALADHVRTDLSAADLIAIAATYQGTCHAESMEMLTLHGVVASYLDPIFGVQLSYVVVDEAEVRQKVAALTAG